MQALSASAATTVGRHGEAAVPPAVAAAVRRASAPQRAAPSAAVAGRAAGAADRVGAARQTRCAGLGHVAWDDRQYAMKQRFASKDSYPKGRKFSAHWCLCLLICSMGICGFHMVGVSGSVKLCLSKFSI